MSEQILYEQFDGLIEQQRAGILAQEADSEMRQLLAIADDLSALPAPEFKARLRNELCERPVAVPRTAAAPIVPRRDAEIFTLFGRENAIFPIKRWNFAYSVAAHAFCVALVVGAGMFAVKSQTQLLRTEVSSDVSDIVLPPGTLGAGGGGGGDRSKIQASNGQAPRFDPVQITPPMVVVRNATPMIEVPPTILGMESKPMVFTQMGDPMSKVLGPASNGTGKNGGIGSGEGGGIGVGISGGLGKGTGGNVGGGIYRVGGGVLAPVPIYSPDPEFSEEARKAKQQGAVVLYVVVGPDGLVKQARVQRSLGLGLDEKAMEAVRTWKFKPAMKNNQPVAVAISVEVNFRLF